MSLIVDTGVLVAAVDRSDPDHGPCAELLSTASERRVVPSPTLVEVEYLLRGSSGWELVLQDIGSGALSVEDLHPGDYDRVGEVMASYADLRIGFVDAAVLAVTERLQESKLATLDRRHFTVVRPAHVDSLQLLPG